MESHKQGHGKSAGSRVGWLVTHGELLIGDTEERRQTPPERPPRRGKG